ncbi:MAG TPA: response regulator [Thermosynechococcaceae cyanobacterium]
MRILLVEDDESIIQILTATLSEQNYVVDVAMDGEAGWQLVETYVYNLVLLDVMLPKLDGISFCQRLRSRRSAVLVMLLTARKTPADKLAGLDSGADDYMVKPFHPAELVARVRALLRRGTTAPSAVLTCGNLRLDPSAREVTCEGQALHLSRKEYLLLELFLHSQQQVFSRGDIVDRLWSYGEDPPVEDTVKSHIKSLRRKLSKAGAVDLVETLYGQGYRINPAYGAVAAVQVPPRPPQPPQTIQATLHRVWEQTRGLCFERVAILEQTIAALQATTLDAAQHQAACQSAHKLSGSLGMFGFDTASQLARKIEEILETNDRPLKSAQVSLAQQLQPWVTAIAHSLTLPLPGEAACATLLVIDSDAAFIQTIEAEAANCGLRVVPAVSLSSSEIQLQLSPAAVLLNLSLVHDPTEQSLWAKSRAGQPQLPILVLSERDDLEERRRATAVGGQLFLRKPVSAQEAIAAVQLLLHPQSQHLKVLAVDDDPQILLGIAAVLQPHRIELVGLEGSGQFWQTLKTVQPDLLILDVNLPQANGLELCRSVRQDFRWHWLPVVLLTDQQDSATRQQGYAAGADDFIAKANLTTELALRVLNRLNRSRSRRPTPEKDFPYT